MTEDVKRLPLGSVISGTAREGDVIPALLDALKNVDNDRAREFEDEIAQSYHDITGREDFWDVDWETTVEEINAAGGDSSELVPLLLDALSEHVPYGCYFGTHEGDGSDIGCWVNEDNIEEGKADGYIVETREAAEDPMIQATHYLEVNDHGNMTMYRRVVTLVEEWSQV